jgi:antitoxin FitA
MEEEAREILKAGLSAKSLKERSLYDAIRKHIDPIGGVELELPPREPTREPPRLDE